MMWHEMTDLSRWATADARAIIAPIFSYLDRGSFSRARRVNHHLYYASNLPSCWQNTCLYVVDGAQFDQHAEVLRKDPSAIVCQPPQISSELLVGVAKARHLQMMSVRISDIEFEELSKLSRLESIHVECYSYLQSMPAQYSIASLLRLCAANALHLSNVSFSDSWGLRNLDLMAICRTCHHLTRVELIRCPLITPDSFVALCFASREDCPL